MGKLIGYARVSTKAQGADRQVADLLGAGVRRDDLYLDHGVSGARASRPGFDQAVGALQQGDTLVVTTLDRLGRSTQTMLELARALREQGVGLRVLNLGGGEVDTATPMGSMVFTVMAALAQMELEIKRERITDSVAKRRAVGRDLGERRQQFTDSQFRSARRLIEAGQPAAQVARDPGMSRATLYRRLKDLCREYVDRMRARVGAGHHTWWPAPTLGYVLGSGRRPWVRQSMRAVYTPGYWAASPKRSHR